MACDVAFQEAGVPIAPIYTPNPFHPDAHGRFIPG